MGEQKKKSRKELSLMVIIHLCIFITMECPLQNNNAACYSGVVPFPLSASCHDMISFNSEAQALKQTFTSDLDVPDKAELHGELLLLVPSVVHCADMAVA